jgi:hypothetical protein
MRRWLSIATFSLILFTLPLWAQHRGGGGGHFGGGSPHFSGGGAHFASHSGFAGHSLAMHASGAFRGGGFGRGSGIHGRRGNRFHHHRDFDGRRGFYPYYPYASYYPYGDYGYEDPFFYDTENEDQDSYASDQAPSYTAPPPEDSGLRSDVQALSGKIDRLQADVEARSRKPEQEPTTALVFRDQHVEEVRNYAIAGGTLWVLNAQAAKKIPLTQLDLVATAKMNDDRGVDFQVPK